MKPILFNTDMVRAILDNRKTVTRRVVKPQPQTDACDNGVRTRSAGGGFIACTWMPSEMFGFLKLPYLPGDILYVRETFFEHNGHFYYKADGKHEALAQLGIYFKWHPSIHMPRKAARIFLRVTNVRVERLQEMQPYDIAFEGFRRQRDFVALWDRTIKSADRAFYGWDANPWVWVIEFERCEKPEEA